MVNEHPSLQDASRPTTTVRLHAVAQPDTRSDPSERRRTDSQLRRLSRQTMGMSGLLDRRPELRGVSTWSEGVVESVLWSA